MKDQRRKEDPEAVEGQLQFALQTDSDPMATDLQVKEQVSAWLGLELMWGLHQNHAKTAVKGCGELYCHLHLHVCRANWPRDLTERRGNSTRGDFLSK